MSTTDELFMLVKSMDKNEKGYFRKSSRLHGSQKEGNYLRLFDCMAAMEEYSDEAIRQKFKGETFIKQLGVTKNYLKNLIVKALRNYYEESDPDIHQLNALSDISVLIRKQLYDSALKLIHKQKKIAESTEYFQVVLSLLYLEHRILVRNVGYPDNITRLDQNIKEELKYSALLQNLTHYKDLQAQMVSIMFEEGSTSRSDIAAIQHVYSDPLLRKSAAALSFKAALLRLETLSRCYQKLDQADQALKTAEEMVALYRANPMQIKRVPYTYIAVLISLINRLVPQRSYRRAFDCIHEIEEISSDPAARLHHGQRERIRLFIYEFKMSLYSKLHEFENGVAFHKALSKQGFQLTKNYELTIIYFSAVCYLGAGQKEAALKLVNSLINGNYEGIREDIMYAVYILNLLVHFDLGNYSIIKRQLKITQNFVHKYGFDTKGWEKFQDAFLQITDAKVKSSKKDLKRYLQLMHDEGTGYGVIDNEFLEWWLADKLKK